MDDSKHDSLTGGLVGQLHHSPYWSSSEPVHAETLCRNSSVPSVRLSDVNLLGKLLLPDLRRSGSLVWYTVWHPANLGHVLFLPQLDTPAAPAHQIHSRISNPRFGDPNRNYKLELRRRIGYSS